MLMILKELISQTRFIFVKFRHDVLQNQRNNKELEHYSADGQKSKPSAGQPKISRINETACYEAKERKY